MGTLAGYVDGLPNLCGQEPLISEAIAAGLAGQVQAVEAIPDDEAPVRRLVRCGETPPAVALLVDGHEARRTGPRETRLRRTQRWRVHVPPRYQLRGPEGDPPGLFPCVL